MNRALIFGAASAIAALLSGCTASLNTNGQQLSAPGCLQPYQGRPHHLDGSLVLSAQSVPSASFVPCLRGVPAGWSVQNFAAQQGHSQISLDLGMSNTDAVTVTLAATCDIGDARPTPSDESGMRRFDQREADAPGYRGTRMYTFAGGCVTDHFDVHGPAATQAVATISGYLSFVRRASLRRYVHDYSHGRFELDPQGRG